MAGDSVAGGMGASVCLPRRGERHARPAPAWIHAAMRHDGRPVDAGWHRRAGRRLMHDDGVSHTSACHLADDVDVKGVPNVAAAVLPQMIKQQSGHVFNTYSIAGRKVFGQGFAVSSASKFAVTTSSKACGWKSARSTTSASPAFNRASSQTSFRHRPPARNIRP
ncbi:SDR family NAD(P)-dependent oxidoreductase [Xanthomonas arboricola]|uniref:SDR family NAD(P)-dependent oxidoreductase n=2 Tax=Xanthomonas arboricola TaxID=56448 RepID=UPI003EB9C85A